MYPTDRVEFGAALDQLFAAWGREASEAQADAYWRYLVDLPMGTVLDGIDAAAKGGGRYVPTVGQIRDAITAERGGPRDTRTQGECEDCDGTGWVRSPYLTKAGGYPQVRACECPIGRTRFTAKARTA